MGTSMLNTISDALRTDSRIVAAWLSGSRGRGTSDHLSDIDLWVAIEDHTISPVVDDPLRFVQTWLPTIMEIRAPSIAPPEGVYLLTWIPHDGGFEQVDWYVVPLSRALRRPDTTVLFEKRPIPVEDEVQVRLSGIALQREVEGATKDALLMVANGRKHLLRGSSWRTIEHIRHAFRALEKVASLLESGEVPTFDQPGRQMIARELPATPEAQLEELKRCLDLLRSCLTRSGRDLPVPDAFDAMDAMLAATSPQ